YRYSPLPEPVKSRSERDVVVGVQLRAEAFAEAAQSIRIDLPVTRAEVELTQPFEVRRVEKKRHALAKLGAFVAADFQLAQPAQRGAIREPAEAVGAQVVLDQRQLAQFPQ